MNKPAMSLPPAPPLAHAAPPVLVCFSHLRWNFVYQRPQHLLSRAAAHYTVYFFEEPVERDDLTEPRLELRRQSSGVVVAVPLLPTGVSETQALEAQRYLLDEILEPHAGSTLVFWYYTPMALRFSGDREPDLCLYDCMDELSAFRGAPPELTRQEAKLFTRADLVFTGGQSLYEAKRARHPNVHAFPSSIDRTHFAAARKVGSPDPADQRQIPHPRIGFFGVIDERMDTGLVARLAARKPDWHFVMLGPVVKIDPARLPHGPNIHWLGSKSYADLPSYLSAWDAGFMPFAINESTRFISPTKTPEFLAAGIPVVSTPVRDVQRPYGDEGLVEIASTPEGFAQALEAVMARPREVWLQSVDHFLADLSWDRTFAEMNQLMATEMARLEKPVATALPTVQQGESARV